MTTHHFANSGNDTTGDGSLLNPWATVAKFNSELAGGGIVAGDSASFLGGDQFTDAEMVISSFTGTGINYLTVTSHGVGRAVIKATSTGRAVASLNLSTNVRFQGINFEHLRGAALGAGDNNIAMVSCTSIIIDDCEVYGGLDGITGSNSSAFVSRTVIRHSWEDGISVFGTLNGQYNLSDVEVFGAGYDDNFVINTNIAAGDGLSAHDSAFFRGSDIRLIKCKTPITNINDTNTTDLRRVWILIDRADQEAAVEQQDAGVTTLRDSIIRVTSAINEPVSYVAVVASVGGTVNLDNVTIHSEAGGSGIIGIFTTGGGGSTLTFDNCNLVAATPGALIGALAAGDTYTGRNNNFWAPNTALPFLDGGAVSFGTWAAAHETSSINQDPLFDNATLPGPEFAKVTSSSPLIGVGLDQTVEYATAGILAVDYFGFERFPGIWSIGAHEFPIPTLQSFLEGNGSATLDGQLDLDNVASLRSVPPFSGFPAIDHKVEGIVRFEYGMKSCGIWAVGGRAGSGAQQPAQPISTSIYQYTFDQGSLQPLENSGAWDIGDTPGTNDPRRIRFEIALIGTALEARIRGSTGQSTTTQSLSFGSTTSGLQGLFPNVQYDTDLKLTLEVKFVGRQSGPGSRNDYIFDFLGYIDDQLVLNTTGVVVPQGWIEGFEITGAVGPASWAGIHGERGTLGGLASPNPELLWKTFGGLIQGTVVPTQIPASAAGEARIKEYMARRGSVPNRALNGGFTSFPRDVKVQRFEDAIQISDPTFVPPPLEIPLHITVVINGSSSMQGGETIRTIAFLQQMIEQLPLDGSIMLFFCSHRNTTAGNYGAIYPNVDVMLPNTILDSTTKAAALAAAAAFSAGGGQERWASGVDACVDAFNTGFPDPSGGAPTVGASKMMIVIDDEGSSDVGINTSNPADAAAVAALHALPGLVEVGICSVEKPTPTVVGRGIHQGSWDAIWPRPDTVVLPNTPLVDPNQATTSYESTVEVPNTQGALVARTGQFLGGNNPSGSPNLPIIQNPPLASIPATANFPSEWCGYTWAQQAIKHAAAAIVTPPPPVPTLGRDVFQAWPDLDAGYAFDVPPEKPAESLLGNWFVSGAAGSVEVAPADDEDAVIPSFDGGNLARVSFGEKGSIEFVQDIPDVKPLRGEHVTVAYSGRRFTGRVRVDAIVRIDGQDNVVDTSFSQSFGEYARRVAAVEVPLNAGKVEVVIRLTANVGESVGLSGIVFALGRYENDLPYSDSIEDSAIPPGTVILATGDACPPGFRQVPDSKDRLALALTSDPGFYERRFLSTTVVPTQGAGVFPHEVDLAIVIDGSGSQGGAGEQVNVTFLTELVQNELPKDGSVSLSIVWTSGPYLGLVILNPTLVTLTSVPTILSAIGVISNPGAIPNFGGATTALDGFTTVKPILESGMGRFKMMVYNTDHGFSNSNVAGVLTAFNDIVTLDRFVEASAYIVNSSRAAVLSVGGENLIFPVPSTSEPGILFESTGGPPGPALPGAHAGLPFQAGQYSAQVLGARVLAHVLFGKSLVQTEFGEGVVSRLGGREFHDHVGVGATGSSLTESDGFEDHTDEPAETLIPIPIRDQASIKPYPFGIFPQFARPEDPPVLAVGPQHGHSVRTDMRALPPSFPVIFCERL